MKVRKKPVVVDAIRFEGFTEGPNYLPKPIADFFFGNDEPVLSNEKGRLIIRSLEGDMECAVGDWIIRGVAGEFYPCKPDIFEATYEFVEAES